VGVVTSPNGAVIRDIINVSRRRFPNADILLIPCAAQGAESARSIARALRRAAQRDDLDVLIVGRGGGSLEDLWGFNGEAVARSIADSPVPVVSAVGHETDFTIADFVADVRVPTPSAAAELVFPQARELRDALRRNLDRGERAIRRQLVHSGQRLESNRLRLGDARGALREYAQALSIARGRLDRSLRDRLSAERSRLDRSERKLEEAHPRVRLQDWRNRNESVRARILASAQTLLATAKAQNDRAGARLHALSPLAVLERGYSIVLDAEGGALRDAAQAKVGQRLKVRLHRGALDAEVKEAIEPQGE
ncbi:MAG: exodeoxyribonuclease VII large subunit, partial [Myxococcota bacterium]